MLATTISAPPARAANNVTYQYDPIGRITQIQRDDGVTFKYSYDANGNRTQQQVITATVGSNFVPASGWWFNPNEAGIAIEFNSDNAVFTGGLIQYGRGQALG